MTSWLHDPLFEYISLPACTLASFIWRHPPSLEISTWLPTFTYPCLIISCFTVGKLAEKISTKILQFVNEGSHFNCALKWFAFVRLYRMLSVVLRLIFLEGECSLWKKSHGLLWYPSIIFFLFKEILSKELYLAIKIMLKKVCFKTQRIDWSEKTVCS